MLYLAGENGVEFICILLIKKIGAGLFGGEGFIMQKASGHGIMFAEFDGHVVEYELETGEQIVCRYWAFGCDDSKLYDGDQKCFRV